MSNLPLSKRMQKIFEEGCASCGMSVGGDGFEGGADAGGPVAGYDPLMKTLKRIKKKRSKKEG